MSEFRAASGLARIVLAVSLVAGLLIIATEFSTVAAVRLADVHETCESRLADQDKEDRCSLSGFERHGGSYLLLGAAVIAMGFGAGIGRSRPAGLALLVLGAIVLLWALLFDLPKTNETGAISRFYDSAEGESGTGLYLELIGGALAVAAGVLSLIGAADRS
jgi:hypothetical protein